ncbi:MAG: FAD-binding oxidoreductase, partial [Emcibacteraceae bacterium]|nr:FAD-binding oxidoreductase [Emcibacteraceae bacterium]
MASVDYIIIGAGIAGSSAAYELSKSGTVAILERESAPGYHTTGRSAAIFETTYGYGDPVIRSLVLASEDFFTNPPQDFTDHDLLRPRSELYIAPRKDYKKLIAYYEKLKKIVSDVRLVEKEEIKKILPILNDDYGHTAILLEGETADIDVHALHEGYLKGARSRGAELYTDNEVTAIERKEDLWHITTPQGEFSAPVIVNAAGSWVDQVAKLAGVAPIGIKPLRRTMVLIDVPEGYGDIDNWPMALELAEVFYFKPDAGKILISPCDQTLSEPCDAQPEEIDVAYATHYFHECTGIEIKKVDHKWAGLRNALDDGYPAVGFSPDATGFFWLAGQEGIGIMTSPALSRIAASMIIGDGIPGDIKAHGID